MLSIIITITSTILATIVFYLVIHKLIKKFVSKEQTFTLTGVTVQGHEEDYFLSREELVSISSLLAKIEIAPISWREASAFEMNDENFDKYKKSYQDRTNLEYPPVYEVIVTIKKKSLSKKESKDFWIDLWHKFNKSL